MPLRQKGLKIDPGVMPLWWAEHKNGKDHPIIAFMKKLGAVKLGPEL